MFYVKILVVFCIFFVQLIYSTNEDNGTNLLRSWQQMFRLKRSQQLVAVKNLIDTDDVQNRQKTIKLLTEAMQKVMIDSRNQLIKAGFEPGMPFPENAEVREALSRILENTAFFADLALHIPDQAVKLYKKDIEWQNLFRWSIEFSNKTEFFDEQTSHLMYLISQELNLVERQENYVNPYRDSFRREREAAEAETMLKKQPKKDKPTTKKGPKLGGRKKEL